MATMLKILEPFTGTKQEDVSKWIKKTLTKAELFNLNSVQTRTLIILLFKGQAEKWYLENKNELSGLSLEELLSKLATRSASQVSTEKILDNFLSRREVQTVEEYDEMLQEASTLFTRQSITSESIIKMVIKRTPPTIQSILYLIAENATSWQNFKARAANVTWLAFDSFSTTNSINAVVKPPKYNHSNNQNHSNKKKGGLQTTR